MTITPYGTGIAAPRNRGHVMISYADVEKLLAVHSEDPPVLPRAGLMTGMRHGY